MNNVMVLNSVWGARFRRIAPLMAALAVGLVGACGGGDSATDPAAHEGASLRERALAAGLAPVPPEPLRPVENPYRKERVDLGHLLFFDPILSGPMDVACSTCHLPSFGFADGRQFPSGAGASGLGPERTDPSPAPLRLMPRNSPPMFNLGVFGRMSPTPTVNGTLFWSGSAFGLEDQALVPITADLELRGLTYSKTHALDSVMNRLRGIPGYLERFGQAYPEIFEVYGMDPQRLVTTITLRRTIAAYLRELITPAAPLDRFLAGDDDALTASQRAGLELFMGKAACTTCHTGPLLSDFSMHVIGAKQEGLGRDTTPGDDVGWGEHGGKLYSFRTPPLRQVELTAPYFHAGTSPTLEDVMRFKNAGRSEHPRVQASDLDSRVRPLGLDEGEIRDIVAFLRALTDRTTVQGPLFQAPAAVPSGLTPPTR